MDILRMKKSDFQSIPERPSWSSPVKHFDSLVIIPMRKMHDSGYRCMEFVAVENGEPFLRLSGCSDVIHIDGIGGYGHITNTLPKTRPPEGWRIDCLPCGYLNLWCSGMISVGNDLSDFNIYFEERRNNG